MSVYRVNIRELAFKSLVIFRIKDFWIKIFPVEDRIFIGIARITQANKRTFETHKVSFAIFVLRLHSKSKFGEFNAVSVFTHFASEETF